MNLKGKKIAVLGLSDSGLDLLKNLGKAGVAADGYGFLTEKSLKKIEKDFKGLPCRMIMNDIPKDGLAAYDLVIETPGAGNYLEALEVAKGRGVKVYADVDFSSEFVKCPIIAVTGTCGKSTTVQLIRSMLEKQGLKVKILGGNVQEWGSVIADKKKYDYCLMELSSFRLKISEHLKPHIAVFLNIFPAHRDRHEGGMIEYVESKAKIFARQGEEDYLVYDAGATNLVELMKQKKPKARQVRFSWESPVSAPGIFRNKLQLIWMGPEGEQEAYNLEEGEGQMPPYAKDVMAAIAVARLCGVSPDRIQQAIDTSRPLPGRLRRYRKINGVFYYDDSMSTNIGATIWALNSFMNPVIWIGGGMLQDGSRLNLLPRHLRGRVKACILVGRFTSTLAEVLEGVAPIYEVKELAKAVQTAKDLAEAGDVVLFSPACPPDPSTMDSDKGRGVEFKKQVKALPKAVKVARPAASFIKI